jgi:hypothetical protein
VSSLKITTGTRRLRAHASARTVAGPNSQLTTQSGSAADSARATPRANVTGERPGRRRCHASRISLE